MLKKKIEKLIDLIENTEIEEIEVSSFWGAQKIRLSKSKGAQNVVMPDAKKETYARQTIDDSPQEQLAEEIQNDSGQIFENNSLKDEKDVLDEDYEDESKFKIITAPLVGTFYSSPKPEDPAFIKLGEKIEKGSIVCIIEAMKIFNEIESEHSGELAHIYVEDGTPVEYGQELFALRISNV